MCGCRAIEAGQADGRDAVLRAQARVGWIALALVRAGKRRVQSALRPFSYASAAAAAALAVVIFAQLQPRNT